MVAAAQPTRAHTQPPAYPPYLSGQLAPPAQWAARILTPAGYRAVGTIPDGPPVEAFDFWSKVQRGGIEPLRGDWPEYQGTRCDNDSCNGPCTSECGLW